MVKDTKNLKDIFFSPKSEFNKLYRNHLIERTPNLFSRTLDTNKKNFLLFNRPKQNIQKEKPKEITGIKYPENSNSQVEFLDKIIQTFTRERDLSQEYYERFPHKITHLITIVHFTIFIFFQNRNSLNFNEHLNNIFSKLFVSTMKKLKILENILSLKDSEETARNKNKLKKKKPSLPKKSGNQIKIEKQELDSIIQDKNYHKSKTINASNLLSRYTSQVKDYDKIIEKEEKEEKEEINNTKEHPKIINNTIGKEENISNLDEKMFKKKVSSVANKIPLKKNKDLESEKGEKGEKVEKNEKVENGPKDFQILSSLKNLQKMSSLREAKIPILSDLAVSKIPKNKKDSLQSFCNMIDITKSKFNSKRILQKNVDSNDSSKNYLKALTARNPQNLIATNEVKDNNDNNDKKTTSSKKIKIVKMVSSNLRNLEEKEENTKIFKNKKTSKTEFTTQNSISAFDNNTNPFKMTNTNTNNSSSINTYQNNEESTSRILPEEILLISEIKEDSNTSNINNNNGFNSNSNININSNNDSNLNSHSNRVKRKSSNIFKKSLFDNFSPNIINKQVSKSENKDGDKDRDKERINETLQFDSPYRFMGIIYEEENLILTKKRKAFTSNLDSLKVNSDFKNLDFIENIQYDRITFEQKNSNIRKFIIGGETEDENNFHKINTDIYNNTNKKNYQDHEYEKNDRYKKNKEESMVDEVFDEVDSQFDDMIELMDDIQFSEFSKENEIEVLSKKSSKINISDFKLILEIAKGGYGRVDLYKKISTGDQYAIKTVDMIKMVIYYLFLFYFI
jgi:hypothetical protein